MQITQATGAFDSAIGFLILVLGLIVLAVFMAVIPRMRKSGQTQSEETVKPAAPAAPVVAQAAAPTTAVQADMQQEEIAAAIAAVIAICTEENNRLVVRPMRRTGIHAPAWNVAGRLNGR